ncbi:hypothetical protein [Streptomyces sp. NPDC047000]|uniref:hypothetical protein n=1 Tax=Streptomyces sp. NPDC047000 TaxID=3155474 RepID=UPI0033E94D3C
MNDSGDRQGCQFGGGDIAVHHAVRHDIACDDGPHGFTCNSNPGTITSNVGIDNAERATR